MINYLQALICLFNTHAKEIRMYFCPILVMKFGLDTINYYLNCY